MQPWAECFLLKRDAMLYTSRMLWHVKERLARTVDNVRVKTDCIIFWR